MVLGLAAALAVAVYVTKVPVPFLNKGQSRTAEQDAAETRKNRNWDPNAPAVRQEPGQGRCRRRRRASSRPRPSVASRSAAPAIAPPAAPPQPAASRPADPLGDLAAARMATPAADPFFYFVQAGAFRTPEDAEAQRAKLSLMGIDAKVTEREQSGPPGVPRAGRPLRQEGRRRPAKGKAGSRRRRNRAGSGAALNAGLSGRPEPSG